MEKRTLEFFLKPDDNEPSLMVEVNYHGDVLSASGYCPIIDDWANVTAFIQNDRFWQNAVGEKFAAIDWQEDADAGYEEYRDGLT